MAEPEQTVKLWDKDPNSKQMIQKKGYTDKGGMVDLNEMISETWKSTPRSVKDTTTQQTGYENRGYHMSN